MADAKSGGTILEKVKRNFMRMTSPTEFGSGDKSFGSVLTMNIPPDLARADAAFARASELLRNRPPDLPDEERPELYSSVLELLDDVERLLSKCAMAVEGSTLDFDVSLYLEMERFVKRIVRLLHQVSLQQKVLDFESKIFIPPYFGAAFQTAFSEADPIFSGCELNSYRFLRGCLDAAEPGIQKLRDHQKRFFSRSDQDRYSRAYEEYSRYYAKVGLRDDANPETETRS